MDLLLRTANSAEQFENIKALITEKINDFKLLQPQNFKDDLVQLEVTQKQQVRFTYNKQFNYFNNLGKILMISNKFTDAYTSWKAVINEVKSN